MYMFREPHCAYCRLETQASQPLLLPLHSAGGLVEVTTPFELVEVAQDGFNGHMLAFCSPFPSKYSVLFGESRMGSRSSISSRGVFTM